MLSNRLDKISFWSFFAVVVLLPIFLLPFSKIPAETSKGLLLVVGLASSVIFWTAARFSDGKIVLPKSGLIVAGFGVVLAFLVSAIFSPALKTSLFGVMLDFGTFYFILAAFLLMFMSSIFLRDSKNAQIVFWGSMISFLAVFLFQAFRLFFPETLSLGVLLSGKTDNLIGSWNAFGVFAGFSAIVSLFFLEFFSTSRLAKWLLGALVALSVLFVILVNFPMVWGILGIFSLLIFVYKVSFSSVRSRDGAEAAHSEKKNFPAVSFTIVMISLLFFVAGQFLGGFLPNRLGISSIEIRPSFGVTASIAGHTLAKSPIFGSGPNRFSNAWSSYKPDAINNTQFWDASFDQGSGVLPTFAVTTGILGILTWLIFLFLFVWTGVKSLFLAGKDNAPNIETIMFFVMSLYLFIASFFYFTGTVMFLLAFAFLGAFIGLSAVGRGNREITFSFLNDPRKSFFSILFLIFIMLISASAGFKYLERFISVPYFQKTLSASTIESAQTNIGNAIALHANDLYWRAYSQVYLVKLNTLVSKGSALSETEKSELQGDLDLAIGGAAQAVAFDKTNYLNQRMLGLVYESAGGMGVTGALDKSLDAYKKASELNPKNPGLKLDLARISFSAKETKNAIDYANQALTMKPDYVDALITLSQLYKSQGDNTKALSYANKALEIVPADKSLTQYVNSLSSASTPVVLPDTTTPKTKK